LLLRLDKDGLVYCSILVYVFYSY